MIRSPSSSLSSSFFHLFFVWYVLPTKSHATTFSPSQFRPLGHTLLLFVFLFLQPSSSTSFSNLGHHWQPKPPIINVHQYVLLACVTSEPPPTTNLYFYVIYRPPPPPLPPSFPLLFLLPHPFFFFFFSFPSSRPIFPL